ncbi:MAG TPA: VWA domain-containing protein [Terriglobales bacterium]|nr:VWA domain-containing protein [Terriglobales bacterium]
MISACDRQRCGVVLMLLISACMAAQQASPPPPPADLSIRTTTRVVLVDAVVIDGSSHAVKGLAASDFTVLEDGKPQKIAFFAFESAAQRQAANPPKLRSDVYTNRPEYHDAEGAMVVLLLDGLNTPPGQQLYVRQQILKYLSDSKLSGRGTAVLALGNDLSVLQDFTSNSELLLAAVRNYKSGRTAVDVETPKIDVPVTTSPGAAPSNVSIPVSNSADVASAAVTNTRPLNTFEELADSLQRFEKRIGVEDQDLRTRTTLASLRLIGRALAGYPGRKALIWCSASFPFNLALDESKDVEFSKSYHDQIRQTSALLSDAHVAVYPIDARGLLTTSSIADASVETRMAKVTQDAAPSPSLASQAFQQFNTEATMDHLAHDTGGEVFRNTNDLGHAVQAAVADAESYYVLGYYPEQKKWDGKFHNIKVITANKQLTIRARSGYFAVDPGDWRKAGDDKSMLSSASLHTLSATGILFYAHPVPPAKRGQPAVVEILVDASTVSFGSGPDFSYNTNLEFQVGAFTPDGKLDRVESQSAQGDVHQDTYQRFMKSGIPVRMELMLKPGRYQVRVAARDNRNGHLGTLDVPLTVPQL